MSGWHVPATARMMMGPLPEKKHNNGKRLLQLALLPQRLNLIGQAPEIDEALGVHLVIVALVEGSQLLGIQSLGGGDACMGHDLPL